ncbi:MAG: hypothetical protein QME89_11650, partial [Actinomycetota bacterium]|nr:hypothetical protein [Actinomycetota bacterium]
LYQFLVTYAATTLSLLILLVGYAVCFCLHFIFWCMSVLLYASRVSGDAEEREGEVKAKGRRRKGSLRRAYRGMLESPWAVFFTGLALGVIVIMANMAAQMVVGLVLGLFLAGGASPGILVVLSTLQFFYLGYFAADLALVLVVTAPQVITMGGGKKVEETLRAAYQLVRPKYGEALKLLLLPEFIVRTLMLGLYFLLPLLKPRVLAVVVFLLCMSLLEGGRTGFVAAAYNRFFLRVLEEERRRKAAEKKKKKGKK